jgi:succinate-semialdehyde dehydrogenase / glutarate-semialdehyde dehydrogenase
MSDFRYHAPYLLINGEKLGSGGRATRGVRNPATGEVIAELPCARAADIDTALELAAGAFLEWKAVAPVERGRILRKAASLLRERSESIAQSMTLEQGKPLQEAQWEIAWTADVIDWQAEEGRRTYGRVIPTTGAGRGMVVKEPVGPVAAFAPWNLPAFIPARKIATALAAGCSCIIKPDEEVPLTALKVATAFLDAGVPPGALSVVFGDPPEISTRLLASSVIRKVSFTGSTRVGKQLAALSGNGVKKLSMELGGHAPTIIFDDVDLDDVVAQSVPYKFLNAGQICSAPTRFYVHVDVHDQFVEKISSAARKLKVGDGRNPETQMGPMANPRRIEAMERLCANAISAGARLTTGGSRIGNRGYYWQPTVLADVPETATIMNEEPFGPVVVTSPFEDEAEVVARSNRLTVGLAGYVFTGAATRASRIAHSLEVGLVGINNFGVFMPEAPFGGIKESGYGSEGGTEGIEAYLTTKFIHQT